MTLRDEPEAYFLPQEFLMTAALAICWPLRQDDPPGGEHFHRRAERLTEILESRLLFDFADLPENDLLYLRLLLRMLDRRVETIRENWDELRALSDLFD